MTPMRMFGALLGLGFVLCAVLVGCECEEANVGQQPRLVLKPKAIVFPGIGVGNKMSLSLEISNGGNAPLQIKSIQLDPAGDPSYRLLKVPTLPLTLAPLAKELVEVAFAPTVSGSPKSEIWIESNDPTTGKAVVPILTASSQPRIQVTPHALDFGFVEQDKTRTLEVKVKNIGSADLHIKDVLIKQVGKDFSLEAGATNAPQVLPPQKEVAIKVNYRPSDSGGDSGELLIASDDEASPQFRVILQGRRSEPDIKVKPLVLDFGGVAPNGSRALSLAIENQGGAPLIISSMELDGGPQKEFSSISPSLPLEIQPGATSKVATFYRPIDKGTDYGTLTIKSNDPDSPVLTVRLIGQSPPAGVVVRPLLLDFGGIPVNATRSLSVTVSNTGGKSIDLTGAVAKSATNVFQLSPAPTTPSSIFPNSSIVLTVAYTPTTNARHTGTLTIQTSDPIQPEVIVQLLGTTVTAPPCFLQAKPSALNFGTIAIGKSQSINVDITNQGSGTCWLFGLKLAFNSDFAFLLTSGQLILPVTLGPNAVHKASVSYTPTQSGAAFGTLDVNYGLNLFQRSPDLHIPLTGLGDGPDLCPQPPTVDFGAIVIGAKGTEVFQLRSCGTKPVTITSIALAKGAGTEYTLDGLPSLPLTLDVGKTIAVTAHFQPTAEAFVSQAVDIQTDAGGTPLKNVQLFGYGITKGKMCGAIRGRICATDKSTWMEGALVSITLANGGTLSARTDRDGYFYLPCVPEGTHQVSAKKGSFQVSFSATVTASQTQNLATPICFDATQTKIAVVWGEYDSIQTFLDQLGLTYTMYGSASQPEGAAMLLTRAQEMARYDIIFINCGADESSLNANMGTRLQNYVKQGGSVYMSDYSYDFLEAGWPDAVDWLGDDTQHDAAQSAPGAQVTGVVHDPLLIYRLGGRTTVPIQYQQCPCTAALSVKDPKVAIITGDRTKSGNSNEPLAVLFQPYPNGGHVAYTTFHNTEQSDRLIGILMRYFVFEL